MVGIKVVRALMIFYPYIRTNHKGVIHDIQNGVESSIEPIDGEKAASHMMAHMKNIKGISNEGKRQAQTGPNRQVNPMGNQKAHQTNQQGHIVSAPQEK